MSLLTSSPLASSSLRKELKINDEEFRQLRDFIYVQCGIFIGENRKYLVENRLAIRIKELNLTSYGEYYNFLRFDPNKRAELSKLFEVVTTNETSFYRNPPQLQVFQDVVLTNTIEGLRKNNQKKLRIWSAGCSTGEEPYTIAIIIHELLKQETLTWDIKITANDLSEAVLVSARRGVYTEYALRTTPKDIIAKYFVPEGSNYKLDAKPKRLVSFGQINLNDKQQLARVERSHIVFCRNVIIYFDETAQAAVINRFWDSMASKSFLFIGHSESLFGMDTKFEFVKTEWATLYRKFT